MYAFVVAIIIIIILFWLYQKQSGKTEGMGKYMSGLKPYIPTYSTTLQRRFGMASAGENFQSPDVGIGTFWAGVQKPSYE